MGPVQRNAAVKRTWRRWSGRLDTTATRDGRRVRRPHFREAVVVTQHTDGSCAVTYEDGGGDASVALEDLFRVEMMAWRA